ncbi:hypothetical protein [Streptomyces sp. NPDC090994]|uniref:hypothetical protein n=1 Tax=Streptomyces sp. NPDC090994 TaxID=3365969 RepID=UPI003817E960
MVRRRWAVALVLLLASVLLNLCAPEPPPDAFASVSAPAVAAADTGDESLTEPSPCEDGTAVRRAALRPARTAGAAGAGCADGGAPVRASAADRDATEPRGAVTAVRPASLGPSPGAELLRTYRC